MKSMKRYKEPDSEKFDDDSISVPKGPAIALQYSNFVIKNLSTLSLKLSQRSLDDIQIAEFC